jgi:putative cell wall-binding protein
MKRLLAIILLSFVALSAMPNAPLAQQSSCPDTHYRCSPGVCCPK